MAPTKPTQTVLARRSSLLADLRIIVLASWAFLLQLIRSWRLTRQLLEPANDDQRQP